MERLVFNENKNIIFNRLKAIRKRRGVSQTDLAARLQVLNINIDQQMLSKIEKNKRIVTDYELVGLCKALKVSVSEMLMGTDEFFEY